MALAGCHDDDDDGPSGSATLSGQAAKGPIADGTVTAYSIASGAKGAVLATTTTDSAGAYSLSIENYTGPVLLEVTGGSYVDEATGSTVTLAGVLQAVVGNVTAGSTLDVQITPLTTLATARALATAGGLTTANIDAANDEVGDYFGGIDLLATQPVNPSASGSATGASQAAIDYGMVLGGLSTLAQTLGLPDAQDLITALAEDFEDGVFDGESGGAPVNLNDAPIDPATGTSDLGAAVSAFSADADNVSGGTVSPELVTALQAPGAVTYTIGGTVSGLTGTGLVLHDNGGDALSVSADGAFTFATSLGSGGTYNVTVATQPSGQTCTVASGSGTVGSANVTNVAVNCVASGSGGSGTATVTITSATPTTGNGSMVVSGVTAEVDGALTRVSVVGTINGLSAELKLYYTTATPTDVTNISFSWDSLSNVVFKDPDSFEVLVDKPNGQINLDVLGLSDADGIIVITPTKTADVSATINVSLP